jgi:hypothetical protein
MKEIKDSDLRELRRIHDSIPEDLKKRLTYERLVTPGMAQGIELMLRDKNLTPELKQRLETVKESGYFSQKETVTNRTAEKKISHYLDEQIRRSIEAGRLTDNRKKHAKDIKEL